MLKDWTHIWALSLDCVSLKAYPGHICLFHPSSRDLSIQEKSPWKTSRARGPQPLIFQSSRIFSSSENRGNMLKQWVERGRKKRKKEGRLKGREREEQAKPLDWVEYHAGQLGSSQRMLIACPLSLVHRSHPPMLSSTCASAFGWKGFETQKGVALREQVS